MAIAYTTFTYSVSAGSTGGATTAFDTTGATLIVVSISAVIGVTLTISDNKANTFIPLNEYSLTLGQHRLYYVLNPTVGSGHIIGVTGTNSYPAIIAYAFSGNIIYDGQQNGATGTSSPLSTGNVTPSANGALIITGMCSDPIATDTIPTGFTGGFTLPRNAILAGNMQGSAAYLIQSTAATINPQWTWSGGTHSTAVTSVAVFTEISNTQVKLSQLPVEAAILSDAPLTARVSQLPIEAAILSDAPLTVRLSQLAIEVLIDTSIIPPTSTETTQFTIII